MKKLILIALCLALLLPLAACGGSETPAETKTATPTQSETPTPTPTPTVTQTQSETPTGTPSSSAEDFRRVSGVYYRVNHDAKKELGLCLVALSENGEFGCEYGFFSSYYGTGKYTVYGDLITLSDREATYCFRFTDGNLVFVAEGSNVSDIPDGEVFMSEENMPTETPTPTPTPTPTVTPTPATVESVAGRYMIEPEEGRVGGFTLVLDPLGKFFYTGGGLSVYLGVGRFEVNGSEILLYEKEDTPEETHVYVFRYEGDRLVFDGKFSDEIYVYKIADGSVLLREQEEEPVDISGEYFYHMDGVAEIFGIKLNADGRCSFALNGEIAQYNVLSGVGTYVYEDGIVTLTEQRFDRNRTFLFEYSDGKLTFLADGSDTFGEVSLPDGAVFHYSSGNVQTDAT